MDFPELRAQLEAYENAKAKAEDRDEAGKLTPAARAARETLRNGLLLQMPIKRARRQYEKAVRKRRALAEKAVTEALLLYVEYDQYQRELDILDEFDPPAQNDAVPSRERPDQDKTDAMARPLVDGLIERGLAPSTIGRLTDLHKDLFAKMIIDLRDDPEVADPKNLWGQMARAGILDAYVAGMTQEQAAAVNFARSMQGHDGMAAEFAEKVREACGLPAGFSSDFLKGIYHLEKHHDGISEGQARAYSRAYRLTRDRDIELLGKLLGRDENTDLDRLQALTHFLYQRTRHEVHDSSVELQVIAVRNEFDRLEAHNRSTEDWARDVPKMIASLADDFADTVPGLEAFDMLLWNGFRLSSTYRELERQREQRKEEERRDLFHDSICQACSWDLQFKIVDDIVRMEGEDGFDEIDAKVWDRASWETEHGRLFNNSFCENKDDEAAPDGEVVGQDASDIEVADHAPDYLVEDGLDQDLKDAGEQFASEPVLSQNLPVVIVPQHSATPSLFDFELRGPQRSQGSQAKAEAALSGGVSANRPRPFPRKSIDQLTDKDFR